MSHGGRHGRRRQRAVILSGRAPAWMSTAGSGECACRHVGRPARATGRHACRGSGIGSRSRGGRSYMHGLAGAIASRSEQRGWHRPQIYGHSKKQHFGEIGHPIIASDIIGGIQPAFCNYLIAKQIYRTPAPTSVALRYTSVANPYFAGRIFHDLPQCQRHRCGL